MQNSILLGIVAVACAPVADPASIDPTLASGPTRPDVGMPDDEGLEGDGELLEALPSGLDAVPYAPIEWVWSDDPERLVIRDQQAWDDYWGARPPPEVDFDQSAVYVHGRGRFTSGFHPTTVLGVYGDDERIYVHLETEDPGLGCPAAAVVTWSGTALTVPADGRAIAVVVQSSRDDCVVFP